jgi:hypothetical protein
MIPFFLERPLTALFSGLLLLYNPPLLDILPMYVIFMLASPVLLLHGSHRGWGGILLASGAIWLAAQFGLSQAAYDALVRFTGLPVPYRRRVASRCWRGSSCGWRPLDGWGRPWSGRCKPTPFPRWAVTGALAYAVCTCVAPCGRQSRSRTIPRSPCSTTNGSSGRCAC